VLQKQDQLNESIYYLHEKRSTCVSLLFYIKELSMDSRKRITSIDDVRVILMLLGVIFHAAGDVSKPVAGFNEWNWFVDVIHVFRMQAFFIISGYITLSSMQKSQFIIKRARQLLLPAMTAVIFLIIPVRYFFVNDYVTLLDAANTWFLIALFSLVVINTVLWRVGVVAWLYTHIKQHPYKSAVMVLIVQIAAEMMRHRIDNRWEWSSYFSLTQSVSKVIDYELYYLAGMVLALKAKTTNPLNAAGWRWLGLISLIGWMILAAYNPYWVNKAVLRALFGVGICLGVTSLATTTKLDLKWTKPLCGPSLTIYLWHWPLGKIAQYCWEHAHIANHAVVEFLWIAVTSFVGSMMAYYVIKHYAVLRWLWLGEPCPVTLPHLSFHRFGLYRVD
jgi:peptidoglycan/LPS O-acetylase OafA/YrhL